MIRALWTIIVSLVELGFSIAPSDDAVAGEDLQGTVHHMQQIAAE